MSETRWTVGYLPADREDVVVAAGGIAESGAAARGAAAEALLDLIARIGRCEYRLAVGEVPVILIPGLTDGGEVSTAGLAKDLEVMLLCA